MGRVTLVRGERGGGFGQVARCGRGLLCPDCAPVVGAHRAEEIQKAVDWGQSHGCSLSFITLTMRHSAGMAFADLRAAVSDAWRWCINGRRWKRDREEAQVIGYIRAFEATHGRHGWHVHCHVLMLHAGVATADTKGRLLAESMFDRWERGLNGRGYTAIRDSGGLDHRVVAAGSAPLGKYLAKVATGANAALELGSTTTKVGRGPSSRTPWEVLRDALGEVEAGVVGGRSARLWGEWIAGTRYWKTVHWSRGLRDLVGAVDLTDEEIVEQEHGHEVVGLIDRDGYRWLLRRENVAHLRGLLETLDDPATTVVDLALACPLIDIHSPPSSPI